MTFPQNLPPSVVSPEVIITENFTSIAWAGVYSNDPTIASPLHRGYNAGRWGGFDYAGEDHTFGASVTTYVSVVRADGTLNFSTSSTNYNNATTHAKVETVVTGASTVTAVTDDRGGPGGAHGGGGASAGAGTEIKGLTFTSDTGSTADSDPGAGLFKWNNATQGSSTILYFDNLTLDAVSLTTLWASLGTAGFIYLQQADDPTKWQEWKWTALPVDGTGYRKFTVVLQASGGSIADDKTVYVDFESAGTPSTPGADNFGYLNVPQNSQSTAYTTVLADAGKHILHPTADNNARTFTIDSNANVAYPIGTALTFVNEINVVTIAITSDTMKLAGAGTTGSRTLAANGIATALKTGTTSWLINGAGLT